MQSPLIARQRRLYGYGALGNFGAISTVARPIATTATTAATGAAVGGTAAAIGAGSAIGLGAAAGSVVPIIGTAIGAIVGLVASGVFNKKQDPEQRNFDQAIAMWQANRLSVLSIANKYLALAGFFDLTNSQAGRIRIYRKYGRMGEQRFLSDMMGLIYQAAQNGQITANDSPQSIYTRFVLPWEDSWGFGPEPSNPHSDFLDVLLMGLIADYIAGNQRAWTARSGDYPFTTLPPFSLRTVGGGSVTPALVAPAPVTVGRVPLPSVIPPSITAPVSRVTPPVTTTTPSTTTVTVPAGYTLIGSANGLPAYQGLDGLFYSWNGVSMSPLTGTLTLSSGQSGYVVQGQVQSNTPASTSTAYPSLTSAGQQSYNASAPYTADPGYSLPQPAASATATTPVAAAGLGAGLPSWVGWAGAAAIVGYLLLGSGKPLRGTMKGGQ